MLSSRRRIVRRMWVVVLVVGISLGADAVSATTINVPGDQPTIQGGIDAAVDGDTVLVGPGTWTENLTATAKAVSVLAEFGPNSTVLLVTSAENLFVHAVQADTFRLIGFEIRNTGLGIAIRGVNSLLCVESCRLKDIEGILGGFSFSDTYVTFRNNVFLDLLTK